MAPRAHAWSAGAARPPAGARARSGDDGVVALQQGVGNRAFGALMRRQLQRDPKTFEQEIPIGGIEYYVTGQRQLGRVRGAPRRRAEAPRQRRAQGRQGPDSACARSPLADETISDAERLFLAALLDPANADLIKAVRSEEAGGTAAQAEVRARRRDGQAAPRGGRHRPAREGLRRHREPGRGLHARAEARRGAGEVRQGARCRGQGCPRGDAGGRLGQHAGRHGGRRDHLCDRRGREASAGRRHQGRADQGRRDAARRPGQVHADRDGRPAQGRHDVPRALLRRSAT